MEKFFVVRRLGGYLYTFEAAYAAMVLAACAWFLVRRADKRFLQAMLLASFFHTLLEAYAGAVGLRQIEPATLFGIIPLPYPATAVIIGFFEGGVAGLIGYSLALAAIDRDRLAGRLAAILLASLLLFSMAGALRMAHVVRREPGVMEVTRRVMFDARLLYVQAAGSGFALLALLPWRRVRHEWKIGFAFYYLGLVAFALVLALPLQAAGIRYVAIGPGAEPASFWRQVLLMYGYNIPVEGASYLLIAYPFLCWTGLLSFGRNKRSSRVPIHYPNLRSRIMLGQVARLQPISDKPNHPLWVPFLSWYERRVLKVNVAGIRIDRPIFLLGLPRSGTTMLQDLLCSHERVAYLTNAMQLCTSSCCAVRALRLKLGLDFETERFLGDSVTVSAGSPSDNVAMWLNWLHEDPYSLEYRERRIEDFAQAEIEALYTLIRKIIWAHGNDNKRFFSKVHLALPQLRLIKSLFPDGRFVHVVRDPRMTANSLLKLGRRIREHEAGHGWALKNGPGRVPAIYPRFPRLAEYVKEYGAEDVRTAAHIWNDAVAFVNVAKNELPVFHELRYEDILAEPERRISELLAFCDLPEPAPDNVAFRGKLAGIGSVRHVNRYESFDVIEDICREWMLKYGYEPGAPSTRPVNS